MQNTSPFFLDANNYIQQVSVDCVIFGYVDRQLKVLVSKIALKGDYFAILSGYIRQQESLQEAVARCLQERTGLTGLYMEQFQVYGNADRNNKAIFEEIFARNQEEFTINGKTLQDYEWLTRRFLSIGFYALADIEKVRPRTSPIDESVDWYDLPALPSLILDHHTMVQDALTALRHNFDRKLIAYNLLPEQFTMRELQELYEAVYDTPFPNNNFQKKMLSLDILERLGKLYTGAKNKAPYLYRFKHQPQIT